MNRLETIIVRRIFMVAAALLVILVVCSTYCRGQVAMYRGRVYSAPVCTSRNCSMCNAIRSQLYSRTVTRYRGVVDTPVITTPIVSTAAAGQQPLSNALINQCLHALQITSSDVFCDLGCGDGRILIAAVRRFGCRAIGVEIDRAQAQKAVAAIERAGLSDKIAVIVQDAATFRPQAYGVTCATAYLFPETLAKIRHTIKAIDRVAVPLHLIPGRAPNRTVGDVHLYSSQSAPIVAPRLPVSGRAALIYEIVP